jgi:serine/threonine protein kinase
MPGQIVPPMAPLGMPHMPHYAAPPRMAPPPMPYGNSYNYFGMAPQQHMPQPMTKPKEKVDESKLLRTVADNSSVINSTVERFVDKETGQSRMFMPDELMREFPHIAKGTFGVVFKGKIKGYDKTVVIKDMEVHNSRNVEDWKREIQIMSQNRCPYVVDVLGYCASGKILTIVMEFMENGSLYNVLHVKHDPLSLLQRMRMARHCALGLAHLHSKGVLHRDIKSMNILVSSDFSCKLTDFGCAKLINSDHQIFNTANSGTPLWMAPEVKRGIYNFSADIYSLGLVLYELFENKLPYFDQVTQSVVLPPRFQSASVVFPCLNTMRPEARPSAAQLVKVLDQMIRNSVTKVKNLLPTDEQLFLKSQKESHSIGHDHALFDDDIETELVDLYNHLLTKDSKYVDELIAKAYDTSTQLAPTSSTLAGSTSVTRAPLSSSAPIAQPPLTPSNSYLAPQPVNNLPNHHRAASQPVIPSVPMGSSPTTQNFMLPPPYGQPASNNMPSMNHPPPYSGNAQVGPPPYKPTKAVNLEDTIDLLDNNDFSKPSSQINMSSSPANSITHSSGSNPEPLIVLDDSIVGSDFSAPRGQQKVPQVKLANPLVDDKNGSNSSTHSWPDAATQNQLIDFAGFTPPAQRRNPSMPMEISPVNPRAPQQPFMNQGSNSAPQSLYPQQFSQNVYMDSLDKSKDFYVPLGQNSNGPVSRPSSDLTTVFSRDDLNKLNDTLNKMPVDTLKGLLDKSQIDYRKCLHKDDFIGYVKRYCSTKVLADIINNNPEMGSLNVEGAKQMYYLYADDVQRGINREAVVLILSELLKGRMQEVRIRSQVSAYFNELDGSRSGLLTLEPFLSIYSNLWCECN